MPAGRGDAHARPRRDDAGAARGSRSIKSLGPDTGRELIISSPGGIFEAFIAEVTQAMAQASPDKPADFRGIAGKYGIEFLE